MYCISCCIVISSKTYIYIIIVTSNFCSGPLSRSFKTCTSHLLSLTYHTLQYTHTLYTLRTMHCISRCIVISSKIYIYIYNWLIIVTRIYIYIYLFNFCSGPLSTSFKPCTSHLLSFASANHGSEPHSHGPSGPSGAETASRSRPHKWWLPESGQNWAHPGDVKTQSPSQGPKGSEQYEPWIWAMTAAVLLCYHHELPSREVLKPPCDLWSRLRWMAWIRFQIFFGPEHLNHTEIDMTRAAFGFKCCNCYANYDEQK